MDKIFLLLLGLSTAPAVWLGVHYDALNLVLPLLGLLFLISVYLRYKSLKKYLGTGISSGSEKTSFLRRLLSHKNSALALAILGALLCAASVLFKSYDLVLWYPVFVNILFFLIFFNSLYAEHCIIEYFAMLGGAKVTPYVRAYTRKVTVAWCLFFAINGGIAMYTVLYGNIDLWTLYNGLLSYIAMGVMFAGEFVIRQFVKRKEDKDGV